MPRPVFRGERCKGCGLCVAICPKKIIKIGTHFNSRGYRPATCVDEALCIGCTLCGKTCPDLVIEIYK
ncbi:MAG: 4Fe-4S ferredoxin iron-sulfur binding protein [Pelosinus sp.]|jgi:2-oxoglutarate ferredoxin oxidoreductase subunit delta|nr:4Fe-4S ferredoxin iron-sulfur binding protein [Pelosinus sp.]